MPGVLVRVPGHVGLVAHLQVDDGGPVGPGIGAHDFVARHGSHLLVGRGSAAVLVEDEAENARHAQQPARDAPARV